MDARTRAAVASVVDVAIPFAIACFLLLLAVFEVQSPGPAGRSLADFAAQAKQGNVAEITVDGTDVCYRLAGDSRLYRARLEGGNVVRNVLGTIGVGQEGLPKIRMAECQPSLLPWWAAITIGFGVHFACGFIGAAFGATPGMLLLGARVRKQGSKEDSKAPGPAIALIRTIASVFSAAALFAGYLSAFRDEHGQTWHDKIARTIVVVR